MYLILSRKKSYVKTFKTINKLYITGDISSTSCKVVGVSKGHGKTSVTEIGGGRVGNRW